MQVVKLYEKLYGNPLKDNEKFTNYIDFITKHNINVLEMGEIINKPFNQIGGQGQIMEFEIGTEKFIARLVHTKASNKKDGNVQSLYFMSINDVREKEIVCSIVLFDNDSKIATLQSLSNYDNCLWCVDKDIPFKIGDVFVRIIINICKKKEMKKIVLTDNSNIGCFDTYNKKLDRNKEYVRNDKFILKVLRTLTDGEPYYCKFGFLPKDSDIKVYNHNQKIFKKEPLMKNIDLDKLIKDYIKEPKYIDVYKKIIKPIINDNPNIIVSDFIKKILSINLTQLEKSIICFILNKIYFDIYKVCGYEYYGKNVFELKL